MNLSRLFNQLLDIRNFGTLLALTALITLLLGSFIQHRTDWTLQRVVIDLWANVGSELASIAITILVIDSLNQRRERENEIRREKQRLIRQFSSIVNDDTRRAAEDLAANGWLYDRSLANIDLSNANLANVNLNEAVLTGVKLRNANVSGAQCSNTLLNNADLSFADFSHATIRGADLSGATLNRTYLQGAQVSNTVMPENWTKALDLLTNLRGSERDFSGWNMSMFNLKDAILSGTRCVATVFYDAYLGGVDFTRADLTRANLWQADLTGATLTDARLENASLFGAKLVAADLGGVNLDNATLQNADLTRANLQGASLNQTSLSGAVLVNVDLKDARGISERQLQMTYALRGAILPDGTRYDGRFKLKGDLDAALAQGIDTNNLSDMLAFYDV